jgi:hypothetical protein
MTETTWKPHLHHGELDTKDREELPQSVYAFPKQRKEPLTDAEHVRNALARFDQVKEVSDADRDLAFANILKAARHFGVIIEEDNWQLVINTTHHYRSRSHTGRSPRKFKTKGTVGFNGGKMCLHMIQMDWIT